MRAGCVHFSGGVCYSDFTEIHLCLQEYVDKIRTLNRKFADNDKFKMVRSENEY